MIDETICSIFPIDKNYYLWVEYKSKTNTIYYITSNKSRTEYQLWKENKQTRYKSENPLDLNKYIK